LLSVAGVNRVITMDLHADQIQGFFDVPVDHLYESYVIIPYLQTLNLDNIKTIKDLGFGGIVICGDLWNRFNIHNEIDYKELLVHFEKLRKATE